MSIVKHVVSTSGALAKGIGTGTVSLARTIGLKRGLIGLAIAGVAAGAGIVLVRFIKQRGEGEKVVKVANGVTRRKPHHKKNKYTAHAVQH